MSRANEDFDLFDQDLRDDDRRANGIFADSSTYVVDIREYDVPYHVRVMIDLSRSRGSSPWKETELTKAKISGLGSGTWSKPRIM